uniref:Transcription regulator Myc N-terminal domain-containing protein n=1 Tax=Amphimedon queenslandica TaxID=400682 RepID=A0A1X7SZT9_AMPQE
MASLVESGAELLPHLDEEKMQYMAFTEAISFAEQFESPLYDLHEETFRELYLRPSPPLSPDDCEPSCSQSPVEETPTNSQPNQEQARVQDNISTDAMADSLISNIMEYEQIMDALQEAEFALSSGSSQPAEDLLIQDCMWSASSSDDNRTNSGGTDKNSTDSSSTSPATGTEPSSSSAECCVVKPSAVFPNLHHAAPQTTPIYTIIIRISLPTSRMIQQAATLNGNHHPQYIPQVAGGGYQTTSSSSPWHSYYTTQPPTAVV